MKVVGLITEYNPFHNGHKYHIEKSRELTGANYVIAVMSGNYVQRGAPALTDKYARTMMALNNGVDLVFELPVCYACGSAQYFALGAVALLSRLGIVDCLCFGSECGDIDILEDAAGLFLNSPESFHNLLYSYIKEGFSYPAARAKAARQTLYTGEKPAPDGKNERLSEIISEPNNILGIEYIRALRQINSAIKPVTIKRHKAHYHDTALGADPYGHEGNDFEAAISSATAIRQVLEKAGSHNDFSDIKNSVPEWVYDYLSFNYKKKYPVTIEDFSAIIKYKILSETKDELASCLDLTSDLADRVKNINIINMSMEEISREIKAKNITLTRVNRALLHVLLNIKTEALKEYINNGIIYYARILGMKKEASHLVRKIKNHGDLPVITKVADAYRQLNDTGMQMFNQDIFAARLYNQIVYEKFNTVIPDEYKHGICMI